LINTNDIIDDEISNIYKYKNFCVKVIIVDVDGIDKKILNYDYKLIRPLNDKKIIELMSMIYVTNLYQSKSAHNQIFRNDKAYKLSDVLGSDLLESVTEVMSSPASPPQIKKNIKILVGEDNKQNQKVIVALLNSIGWTNITLADDGFKTFKELTDGNYDVAFIDLKMPIMSGISAVTQFKKMCEKDTVTIAVTASVADDIKKKCLDAKMDGFIAKPIDVKSLESVMDSVVSKRFKTLFK
jgi:CheY-like chemotaxis protein